DADVADLFLPLELFADLLELRQRYRDADDRREVQPNRPRRGNGDDVDQALRDELRYPLADRGLRDVQVPRDLGVRPPPVGLQDLDHPAVDLIEDLCSGPA